MIKRFAQAAVLLSIGSCLCMAAPNADASSPMDLEVSASQSDQESVVRQGLPGRRIGGGSRSDGLFVHEADTLSALTAPEPLTVTTAAYPEMLFYIPEMKTDNSVEFVMLNAAGDVVYEQLLVAEREAGLMSIETASIEDAAPLSLNENYEWYFSIIPDADDRAHDVVVHGSIRRVDSTEWLARQRVDSQLGNRIATAEPLVQAQMLYEEANLWHDAALVLNKLRQANPESEAIAFEWNRLLDAADLSNVAEASISVSSN